MPNKRKQSRYWTNLRAAETKIINYYLDCTETVVDAAALMQMDTAWVYKKMRDLDIPSPRAAKDAEKEPPVEEMPDVEPEVLNAIDDVGANGSGSEDEDDDVMGVVVFPAPLPDPRRDEDDWEE